jgi:hypothetical protein
MMPESGKLVKYRGNTGWREVFFVGKIHGPIAVPIGGCISLIIMKL